jgi:hypothetical protein
VAILDTPIRVGGMVVGNRRYRAHGNPEVRRPDRG